MGRAKAWLPWFGRSMIEHVVERLLPAVDEVVVVTSTELDLPRLPARVVSDRAPELGPLAGIREGLAAADAVVQAEFAFVTSVDAPHLSAEFVEQMFAFGTVAAPVAENRVQVLSAVYPCDAWRRADELLSRGVRRPLALLEELGYKPIDSACWASSTRFAWLGFNTPAEYLDAVRSRDPDATAEVELLGRAARKASASRHRLPVGTLGEVLSNLPESLSLIEGGRVAKSHLVSLGGRDLVRDLAVPVGPDERVIVIDALAGG